MSVDTCHTLICVCVSCCSILPIKGSWLVNRRFSHVASLCRYDGCWSIYNRRCLPVANSRSLFPHRFTCADETVEWWQTNCGSAFVNRDICRNAQSVNFWSSEVRMQRRRGTVVSAILRVMKMWGKRFRADWCWEPKEIASDQNFQDWDIDSIAAYLCLHSATTRYVSP